ncbi:aminotransferase class I/II-fold pyridoxal phosphate-dependent enzyme [Cryobacterium sp. Y57]|uniref:aminotransferase class I/II-fold pyridoxal phosphate-dependent enzyme n=1 Tax=Cryobacterium sp. Y57 TaxID=2048287 RepID=UPI000CE31184|nr:aminotransferase class I/II-fold pyridoxal phosphate-dependent enzyme [Cryobacterium sp. Y57]
MTPSGFDPEALDQLTISDLRARGSRRWADAHDGEIAAGLAEMDLGVAPVILDRVRALNRYGYVTSAELVAVAGACSEWLAAHRSWAVEPDRIAVVPDVVDAVQRLVELQTGPGDAVVVSTPSYAPLAAAARRAGRRVVEVPLTAVGRLNLADIGQALRGGGRLVMLCQPQNPTGTISGPVELAGLAELVRQHGAQVLSNEVHAPLSRVPLHAYASVPGASAHSTTIVSASKTFNLSGLKCAQLIFASPAECAQWRRALPRLESSVPVLGAVATTAAYRLGDPWRRDLLDYLGRSDALLLAAGLCAPPAGYFAWLRLADRITTPDLRRRAQVIAADGATFGASGWARLTLATPTPVVADLLQRVTPFLARHSSGASLVPSTSPGTSHHKPPFSGCWRA